MHPESLQKIWQSMPPPVARLVSYVLSLLAGLLIAVMLHYLLFRLSLPGTPFIYVVF